MRSSVECPYAKLIGLNVFDDGVEFNVSNRQKAILLRVPNGRVVGAVVNAAMHPEGVSSSDARSRHRRQRDATDQMRHPRCHSSGKRWVTRPWRARLVGDATEQRVTMVWPASRQGMTAVMAVIPLPGVAESVECLRPRSRAQWRSASVFVPSSTK